MQKYPTKLQNRTKEKKMLHWLNVCVDQKTDKNTRGCCKKEKVLTTKSSYNVQITILQIRYTEPKCIIKANMCKHRLAKNKRYLLVYSYECQTVAKHNKSSTTIMYVNSYEQYKFT